METYLEMDVVIYESCYGLYLISYRCLTHNYLNLYSYWDFFNLSLLFYYTLCFSYLILVSVSYSSKDIFIFFSFSILKNTLLILYSL